MTTTHIRESYIRANTALFSEKAKFTQYLMLDDDLLTVTTLIGDPIYMEGPHMQSMASSGTCTRNCRISPARERRSCYPGFS